MKTAVPNPIMRNLERLEDNIETMRMDLTELCEGHQRALDNWGAADKLIEALCEAAIDLHNASEGFAKTIRETTGKPHPWPASDLAKEKAIAAIHLAEMWIEKTRGESEEKKKFAELMAAHCKPSALSQALAAMPERSEGLVSTHKPDGDAVIEFLLSGSDSGHGHVRPRKDGMKARCGGPGICPICSAEKAEYEWLLAKARGK